MFIRPKARFKDGVWSESGYIAYADDYNTRPIPNIPYDCRKCGVTHLSPAGALYWTAEGDTPEEAAECLTKKLSTG